MGYDQLFPVAGDQLRKADPCPARAVIPSPDLQHVVEVSRPNEFDAHATHGEDNVVCHQRCLANAEKAQVVGTATLQKMQVACVIDKARHVCILEIDALAQNMTGFGETAG